MAPPVYKRRRTGSLIIPASMPMQVDTAPSYMSLRNRTSRNYSTAYRGYRRYGRSGPYQSLSQSDRHQNPVYPTPEVKYLDSGADGNGFTSAAQFAMSGAGFIACINDVGAGTNFFQRVGNQITVRNVSYRFELDLPNPNSSPAGVPVPTSGRVMLIWDKQSNGALPAYTDIFNLANYLSFMNPAAAQRFTILRNQQFSLSSNGDETLFFEGYCQINMRTTFGSVATPTTGALLLVYISDQTTAVSQPLISGCWRVRYLDN